MNSECHNPFLTNRLFCDYLFNFEAVRHFYRWNPHDPCDLLEAVAQVKGYSYHRPELVEILRRQNQRFGCGTKTLDTIDSLGEEKSFVIVTGQQAGLLTGPLLTIYKTLTVLKMAEQLSQKHEYRFIPVFWVVSDDHDFEEVNHVYGIDGENTIRKIEYATFAKQEGRSIGKILLDEGFEQFFDECVHSLRDTEFKASILDMVREAYVEGQSLSDGFCRLMAKLFREYGLVIVDPLDPELMRFAVPIYEQEITGPHRSTSAVLQTNERLTERGYHQQVHVRPGYLNLFLETDGQRRSLSMDGETFQAGGKTYAAEDMLHRARESPQLISPGVILRPVVRSHLLPTVAYVGGPAEISYHAQIQKVYEGFGVPPPVVYPRVHVTLVEKKIRRILEKLNIVPVELFKDTEAVITKTIEGRLPETCQAVFQNAQDEAARIFTHIRDAVVPIDGSLEDLITRSQSKFMHEIGRIEKKAVQAKKKSEKIVVQQIRKSSDHLFPKSSLQERVFNIVPFLVLYGPGLIRRLYDIIDVNMTDHQLIDI
jgi:bacillithiol biosynthesis cysteine-adding enzyme BshC